MSIHVSTRVRAPDYCSPNVEAGDDGASSKPKGREVADEGRNREKSLINCRTYRNVGTLNCRTLREVGKREELAYNFAKSKLDILCVIDHKIVHKEKEDKVRIEDLEDCQLITTSAWKTSNGAAAGGVGILIGKTAKRALSQINPRNKRILEVQFNGNPNITVIVNYAPVEGSSEAESHFETLSNVINDIPKHHIILECGDFNAHLGKADVPYTFHEETNTNGELLLEHASESGMRITNTLFKKRRGKKWTYISDMNGSKTEIDYILVNKKWKNSVHNVEAYNMFSSIGSDHRVVVAKIKLSLRMNKTPKRKISYDWSTLIENTELQQEYNVSVRNRYEALSKEEDTATERYQCFVDANNEVTERLIPKKKKALKNIMAEDCDVERARKEVKKAFNAYDKRPSRSKQKELQRKKECLQKTYLQVEEKELDEMIKRVENADNQRRHGESWKIINKITGRKTAKKSMIKGKTKEERVETWLNHFKTLLGKKDDDGDNKEEEEDEEMDLEKVLNNLDIDDGLFSLSELQKAKKNMKKGKQTGSDNISPEVLQSCDFDDILLSFANRLMVDGQKPQQWSDIDLIPLPKSGDLTDTQNYRGISLISTVAKLINKMVLNRLQPKIDKHLRPNQNGFRPGRRTTSHILALRRLIEGVRSRNRKATILYIDFRKAFDSINRRKMKKILRAYDIPPNLLNTIMKMYENTRAKVISPDGETEFFRILTGVLQGDTLAPYLFVIVLDHVMRQIFAGKEEEFGFTLQRRRSSRFKAVTVTDLDFADDLAITTEEITQAQEILLRLEIEAEKVGLVCNADKTKYQSFNQESGIMKTKDGEVIKEVTNFKYLGAWTESSSKDLKVRKALAWSACHNLSKIWKSNLAQKIKVRLFIATVESVLLYGSETWTMTKALTKEIDGCYTRMLRMAKNVSWMEHRRNEDLYQNLPKVSEKIRQRRMRLAGHCIRHKEEIANKLVLWEPDEGRRSRGRRRTTFIDTLLDDACVNDKFELRTLMEEREEWWRHVENAGRPDGRPR